MRLRPANPALASEHCWTKDEEKESMELRVPGSMETHSHPKRSRRAVCRQTPPFSTTTPRGSHHISDQASSSIIEFQFQPSPAHGTEIERRQDGVHHNRPPARQ